VLEATEDDELTEVLDEADEEAKLDGETLLDEDETMVLEADADADEEVTESSS